MKFTKNQSSRLKIIYHFTDLKEIVKSDIAMVFPSGTLEILGGRYGHIGSSIMSFKIVLKILIKLLEQNEELMVANSTLQLFMKRIWSKVR